MSSKNSKRNLIIIICVAAVIVVGYLLQGFYFHRTGVLRTEYVFSQTASASVSVKGFVVRAEGKKAGKKNPSIVTVPSDKIYSPVVVDGESVSKNECLAYVFGNQKQLEAYKRSVEITERISLLQKLQDSRNIGYLDVAALNSQIISDIGDYVSMAQRNDLSDIDSEIKKINYNITSKKIITGENIDFSKEISALEAEKTQLDKKAKSKKGIEAPIAGYFVSGVDGYESVCDYNKIASDGASVKLVEKALKAKPTETENALGKIISEHAWYFIFNVPLSDSSEFKVRSTVKVSFPTHAVKDIEMKVTAIDRSSDNVAVTLKCLIMNDDLLDLRIEDAVINIGSYTGCKISNEAITSVDGVLGVYVNMGNRAVFKPITVVYSTNRYVIANAFVFDEKDPEATANGAKDEDHKLKPYDKVIIKGMNLYDGKVIS